MKRIKKFLTTLPDDCVYDVMPSPVGDLLLIASNKGLRCILWQDELNTDLCQSILVNYKVDSNNIFLNTTKQQLTEYFSNKRKTFNIKLDVIGTPFQKSAWQQLSQIPYGETINYGEQARRLSDSNKARAVGMANGMNPISIIIPCHRVIGKNGSLTGFGGGLDNKQFLLQLEQK